MKTPSRKVRHFFVLLVLYFIASNCYSANNLAFKKIYKVSPLQNYSLTAPSSNKTVLTDGLYSKGNFWSTKSTLGWSSWQPYPANTVEILIDLGKDSNIGGITFNTARALGAGVNYPTQIAAFVGSTSDRFQYVGDVANDPNNVSGSYQVYKFGLNGIETRGRYLLLLIKPNGPFLFCDEIEVLEGNGQGKANSATLSTSEARLFSQKLSLFTLQRNLLGGLITNIKATASTESTAALTTIQQKVAVVSTLKDGDVLEDEILKVRSTQLRAKYPNKSFLLETFNPWAPLSPSATPSAASADSISMKSPIGGYDHAAFVVTNLTGSLQNIKLTTDPAQPESPLLNLYQVPFVKSAAMEYVADPLMPINGDIALKSGESKMVFLAAKGNTSGIWSKSISITDGTNVQKLAVNIEVSEAALPVNSTLNSINWGYLDFNPIRKIKADAVKDLTNHHTNILVVPPIYLPAVNVLNTVELVKFRDYLLLHSGFSKALLFLNFNDEKRLSLNGKYSFMSNPWKQWFKNYYTALSQIASKAGFPQNQLYIYPYDEMFGQNIDRFIQFAAWARKDIPGIKIYATLEKKESLKALPYLDIAQIINRSDMYAAAISSKKEIWLYGATENTKSLSPYAYYRLMPWRAFTLGFSGVGFWNYADTGSGMSPGTAWDDFDGQRPDFSVIYEGENDSIVSSRRWEAWRLGIEDYELLTMYAARKGRQAAKDLATSVLNAPEDLGKADEVRRLIMDELHS